MGSASRAKKRALSLCRRLGPVSCGYLGDERIILGLPEVAMLKLNACHISM
jgi:hypothetical protein